VVCLDCKASEQPGYKTKWTLKAVDQLRIPMSVLYMPQSCANIGGCTSSGTHPGAFHVKNSQDDLICRLSDTAGL
jgi:hypothetical protein